MAKISDSKANEKVRKYYLDLIEEFLGAEIGEEVLPIANNAITIPTVNELGNEIYVRFTLSIPRGERGGAPYDGHEESASYIKESEEKERVRLEKEKVKEEYSRKKQAERKKQDEEEEEEEGGEE